MSTPIPDQPHSVRHRTTVGQWITALAAIATACATIWLAALHTVVLNSFGDDRADQGIKEVSGRGESHPPALAEPDVNLSTHPAPIAQPSGRAPSRQCANSRGDRLAISASHAIARRSLLRSRLWYFRVAHRTRCWLSRRRK
jgi:hypothetical protein